MIARADALRIPLADRSVDLVIGSPPYIDARLYLEDGEDLGISLECRPWVDWMLRVTTEAMRISKGLVLWVVGGVTRDRNYQPGPEGLLWRWWDSGGECECLRPVIWYRAGIPGSGGDQWFRWDTEYVLAFKRPGLLPFANNTANGIAPKFAPGGEMSYRSANGDRINNGGPISRKEKGEARQKAVENGLGKTMSPRDSSHWSTHDDRKTWNYVPPDIANPGNLLCCPVGGGKLGHSMAHHSEAPYPVPVPAFFINSHSPPSGLVCDPFSGSGSTGQAAMEAGRKYVGFDLRQSQCILSRKRLGTVTPGFVFQD